MTLKDKEVITAGVCKIITDATNAKIDAQAVLFDAKLQGLRNTIYVTVSVSIAWVSVLELILKVLKIT